MSESPIADEPSLLGQVRTVSVAWFGGELIISAKRGDSANLWAAGFTPGTGRLAGNLRRITLGSGNEVLPSVSTDGKLVFANHSYSAGIWEASLDRDATAAGLRRLTQDRALNYRPSISSDGSKLAYVSNRTGNFEVWIRDLVSGAESALTRAPKGKIFAAISRDGGQVAFWDGIGLYLVSTNGGATRLLCERCGRPDDWSPDGKLLGACAVHGSGCGGIRMWDPTTGVLTKIAVHETRETTAPKLSPDGNWLAFHTAENVTSPQPMIGTRQVFIAPYAGHLIPPANWTAVTDGKALDREARWSADGNRIYFLSDRDGFRCIWARKLDPKTKKPLGSIYPVLHLHNPRLSLLHVANTGLVSICPVGEKLTFSMGELTGNLWMTELRQQ